MRLSNQAYDRAKYCVLVVLPALAVFLQGVGDVLDLAEMPLMVSVLNLFTAFLGTVLHIASDNYHGGGKHGYSNASIN